MSKTVQNALRRARARSLTSRATEPSAPTQTTEQGRQPARGRRVQAVELELTPEELERLQGYQGAEWADPLLHGLEDGRISELAAWQSRQALEDMFGRRWRHRLLQKLGPAADKIAKVLDSHGQ